MSETSTNRSRGPSALPDTGATATSTASTGRTQRRSISSIVADYGVAIFLVLLTAAFCIAMPDRFATSANFQQLLGDNAIPGLLALAVVLPLAAGEFDLSVAATLGFTAILTAQLTIQGVPIPLAILSAIVCGLVIGAINAFLVVAIGVNAFIATLGTSTILAGLNLFVTDGRTLFAGIPKDLLHVANNKFIGIDLVFWYYLVGALILWYLLEHTPFGRFLRATGKGREAARLTGVRTSGFLASSFILAGGIAGLCGALQVARIGSVTASIGPEFLLPAYAAAFLGSTTIRRGNFNIWGAVVGTFVLAVGITGLTFAGAPFWMPNVFNGAALIIAVSIATILGKRQQKAH